MTVFNVLFIPPNAAMLVPAEQQMFCIFVDNLEE